MKRRLLLALGCLVGLSSVVAKNKEDVLHIAEIDNQSDGYFKVYRVGKETEYVVFPNSTLQDSIPLGEFKLTIYPVSGAYQSIFIERGRSASGSCFKSDGPFMISYWYGYPTQSSANRIYEQFCTLPSQKSEVGLRIYKDGTAALYAIEGLKPVIGQAQ